MVARIQCRWLMVTSLIIVLVAWSVPSSAQSVVALNESFAGDYNYTVIGGSLRTNPNSGAGANACALGANDSEVLAGIPAGSTIVAAYLYWGGSGATVDNQVTLNGNTIIADRTFTDIFVLGNTYRFFGGFADVTGLVNPVNGQNFTFSGLTVTNGAPFCAVQAVLASWSLLVVYENVATEPLRVINVFDGFQFFGVDQSRSPNRISWCRLFRKGVERS
ncbi:MAG: hypothetical protein AAAFM81_03515 [Pseudomonadota bacterium]